MDKRDPYRKLERAKEHLDNLQQEFLTFKEKQPKPYSFIRFDDLERQRYCIRCELETPPVRLAIIAGDVFYSLRASLDYLVFRLAKGTPPSYPEKTEFPIIKDFNNEGRKDFKRQTIGVPAGALDIIDEFQPYHCWDGRPPEKHPLWRLNVACNVDKHRRLTILGSSVEFQVPKDVFPLITFENGNVMSVALADKDKMALDPRITFDVLFGDTFEELEVPFPEMVYMYNFIAEGLFPRFESFFAQAEK